MRGLNFYVTFYFCITVSDSTSPHLEGNFYVTISFCHNPSTTSSLTYRRTHPNCFHAYVSPLVNHGACKL